VLSALQLDQPMDKATYERELIVRWQGRLNGAARDPRFKKLSVVAVFEGNDGAGKGGAIRRVTGALDARSVRQHSGRRAHRRRACPALPVALLAPVAAARPFRLLRPLLVRPRAGGTHRRLLQPPDWMRAYGEINQFEHALLQHRVVLVKFWLAVSKDEQFRRFKLRETVAFKRFKITAEDWRNREQWAAYEAPCATWWTARPPPPRPGPWWRPTTSTTPASRC
jgi:polyphosphate kinase 2 (PPK2 family)